MTLMEFSLINANGADNTGRRVFTVDDLTSQKIADLKAELEAQIVDQVQRQLAAAMSEKSVA